MQKPVVNVMVKAARAAGNVLLRNLNKLDAINVVEKDRMDYASEVDEQAEQAVIKELRRAYPEAAFLGEEGAPVAVAGRSSSSTRSTAPATTCTASRTGACRSPWSRTANRSTP